MTNDARTTYPVECRISRCKSPATTLVTLDRTGGPETGNRGGGGKPGRFEGAYCYLHAYDRMTNPNLVPGHELADFGDTWTFRPILTHTDGSEQ